MDWYFSFPRTGLDSQSPLPAERTINFCDVLLVPRIYSVQFSLQTDDSAVPTAVARPFNGCSVTIETESAVHGNMTVEVDISGPDPNFV